jgi:hypothetical protein
LGTGGLTLTLAQSPSFKDISGAPGQESTISALVGVTVLIGVFMIVIF